MKRILTTVALTLLFAVSAHAQELVKQITVEGNKRVETQTVLSYLGLRAGETYTPAKGTQAIKALYATGLFENVALNMNNNTLTVEVAENPIVNRVVFEGNDELDDEKLKTVVSLRARSVFTPGKAQDDTNEILSAYRRTGHFLVQVTPEIIRRDQNRVDVIFSIKEGKETEVARIEFVGNRKFSDSDLQSVITTRESAFWRFLTDADSYDPDRLEFDKELLRRHYIEHGYADFNVVSAVAELSRDRGSFIITFTVSEGKRYTFGDVNVNVDQAYDISSEELLKKVTIESGQMYNGSRIEKNIDNLVDFMGTRGYAFIEVNPDIRKNNDARTIDVTFNMSPGPKVYVNRIDIKGNTRTRDYVIRREMRLAEGDAFSTNKLQRSQDRLKFLDYFRDVKVTRKETGAPDRIDLDVKVEEQSTGEFNIGAGFSTFEGILATADISEKNFLGKGQKIRLSFAISGERQDFNLAFTEPYFMGQELSAGVDAFNTERDYQTESSFDQRDTGGALRMGFPMGEFVRNNIRLEGRETEISDVGSGASQFVAAEQGTRVGVLVSNTLSYDTRDSSLLPTKGVSISDTLEYSGFGTDINFVRNKVKASWHKEMWEDWVLSLGANAGVLFDLDGETPIFENFQAGGNSLRGFDTSGIGPRDRITDDALGGRYMFTNNAELRFPIKALDQFGVQGLFFVDGGIVTEFEDHPNIVDSKLYRVAVGTGLFWRSPMGPLRVDLGFPVIDAEEDEKKIFSFSFGTRF